jgi:glutamate 5-kinase
LTDRLGYLNVRNTLIELMDRGVIPIINENDVVAVEEITGDVFGDNDTLSAMAANLVDADLLVMLGEVEGLFTADPHLDPDARLISTVERLDEETESRAGPSWGDDGRGGMATKLEAARLATASGVDVVIAAGTEPDVLVRLANGESIGTAFPATSTKMESRKRWMLSGLSTRGEIMVDEGAANALRQHERSLLAAGVTEVRGTFHRGDIVSIVNGRKAQVACGIANYSSTDLSRIRGVRSVCIENILGRQYGDEVVHRSNMVLL